MLALAEVERSSSPLPLAANPSLVSVSWPRTGYGNKAFTGREWDPETDLYYYRARYYDPKVGRFISEDPIGFEGGVNFYSYVHNDPVSYVDPFGFQAASPSPSPSPSPGAAVCCRPLQGTMGHWTNINHCYIKMGNETWGLYPDSSGDTGIPQRNHPRDFGGTCSACPAPSGSNQRACFEKACDEYPIGEYSATFGPNSNSFAGTLANQCCEGGIPTGLPNAWQIRHEPPKPRPSPSPNRRNPE